MTCYKFETLLPYPLRLKVGSKFPAAYDGLQMDFVHLERMATPRSTGVRISPHLQMPADKYGLYFRSKVALVLPESSILQLLRREKSDLQRVFPSAEPYVAHAFGSPAVGITGTLISLLNQMLGIYRLAYKEWHVGPVASLDIPSWRASKIDGERETFLTLVEQPSRIMQGSPEDDSSASAFFSECLSIGATAAPLPSLEADIHDRVSHGDLMVALILMGLLVEEGIRDHLVGYLALTEGISSVEAESRLVKVSGIAYGIADFVDPPKKKKTCLIEDLTKWKPYRHKEYDQWNVCVRDLRNEIIHRNRKMITPTEAATAWKACFGLLQVSYETFTQILINAGVDVDNAEIKMFRVRSAVPGTDGLWGAFNHT